jgi:predicted nucleotidyltransferase component of viral defense system
MKDYLRQLVAEAPDALAGRHIAREYLQARILSSLQGAGAFVPLAFHGGTALRFLYGIPRYSEDLDFALDGARDTYDFRRYLRAIQSDLTAENYALDVTVKDQAAVHSARIRFQGLLYELGLSPHRNEVLAVKLEVDTNPPAGATLATTVIRRYVLLNLQHHDRASLLAGKLHAILQRRYTKGRDLYDLYWYLANPDWPEPNLAMLNHALEQSAWLGERITPRNWRSTVWRVLSEIDWEQAVADVRPFLMNPHEISLLARESMRKLLHPDA